MNIQPPSRDSQTADRLSAYTSELQECLNLIKDAATRELAVQKYTLLRDRILTQYPAMVDLLDMTWDALLTSRRTAHVWERLCNTEKQLTDRMAESHVQLQQNYLRLVQEQ
ncbi:MAG: hypothetical protein VKJ64_09595 [Leptolyngbyaceae bacterium]|nr:hypothetical protein [Leptolyngbyaceae bacterium]